MRNGHRNKQRPFLRSVLDSLIQTKDFSGGLYLERLAKISFCGTTDNWHGDSDRYCGHAMRTMNMRGLLGLVLSYNHISNPRNFLLWLGS